MTARGGTAVVAVGGNALIVGRGHESIPEQAEAAALTCRYLADMAEAGWRLVITHGNGPQVGFILRSSELAMGEVPPVPMDYASADTQGAIGYMFQRALHNEFRRRKLALEAVTVVTQVLVERDDPAFARPTKPIGSAMDEDVARALAARHGWTVREDPGRGWRRVVPSPQPEQIVELRAITQLSREGYVVIACGGGGIPVYEDAAGSLCGVEAVVDKDHASSLLARGMGAEMLLMSTSVAGVALDFGTQAERWLESMTVAEARRYLDQGQFAEGSMAPKIRAIVAYLEHGGGAAVVTDPPNLGRALRGEAGTRIFPD